MSNENPAINPIVDATTSQEPWSVALARKHAADAYNTSPDDSDYNYLASATRADWLPHDWVVNAIREAHDMGVLQGRADGNAVAEAQADQNDLERTGIVRATIAAVLESQKETFVDAGVKVPYVDLDTRKLATVFDRVDLDFTANEDGTLTYELVEGARKPEGAA